MELLDELINGGSNTVPPERLTKDKAFAFKGRRNNNNKSSWENNSDLYETQDNTISAIYDYVIQNLSGNDAIMFYEPAMGNGKIVNYFKSKGLNIVGTDKHTQSASVDFIEDTIPDCYDFIITNPPFNQATSFIAKCYESRKPFLLLLPFEYLATSSRYSLFYEHGVVVYIVFPRARFVADGKEKQVGDVAWYYGNSGLVGKGEITVKHCCDVDYINTFVE